LAIFAVDFHPGKRLFEKLREYLRQGLKVVLGDGYTSVFLVGPTRACMELRFKPSTPRSLKPTSKRWIVNLARRLSRDYEKMAATSEAPWSISPCFPFFSKGSRIPCLILLANFSDRLRYR
jgi:hypothetical protein